MLGCSGVYRDIQECAGVCRAMLECAGTCWGVLGCARVYWGPKRTEKQLFLRFSGSHCETWASVPSLEGEE